MYLIQANSHQLQRKPGNLEQSVLTLCVSVSVLTLPCKPWHAPGSCCTEPSDQRPATACHGSCSSWAWAFLAMGTGSEGCRDKGWVHSWVLPQHSSGSQPAPASERWQMGSTRTYHDTGVACPLKKLPWVFSRAQLSENTHCRKHKRQTLTKTVPYKNTCILDLDKGELR